MTSVARTSRGGPARSPQRQTGFCVPGAQGQGQDDDTDMNEGGVNEETYEDQQQPRRQQPLAIPRVGATSPSSLAMQSQSTSDVPTPPDGVSLAAHHHTANSVSGGGVVQSPHAVASGSYRKPSVGSMRAGSISAAPDSAEAWLGRRAAPYGVSHGSSAGGTPRSLASSNGAGGRFAPYLSTSFRTSAERGGAMTDEEGASADEEMEMDEADDVFGWSPRASSSAGGLGLRGASMASQPTSSTMAQGRYTSTRGTSQTGAAGAGEATDDSAGVFDFSSPCFGPRSLEADGDADVDASMLPSPPAESKAQAQDATIRRTSQARRLMSPGWTATSLSRMTLGSSEAPGATGAASGQAGLSSVFGMSPSAGTASAAGPSRSSRGAGGASASSAAASASSLALSRSLPSSAAASAQQRRLSFTRRPLLNPAHSYSYAAPGAASAGSPYAYPSSSSATAGTASPGAHGSSRSRSRSRPRGEAARASTPRSSASTLGEVDDDETDDEMLVDDEDEGGGATADGGTGGAFGTASQLTIRGRRAPSVESSASSAVRDTFGAASPPAQAHAGLHFHSAQGSSWNGTAPPQTTMSASYERASAHMSGAQPLARGYSNDRHHLYAHHQLARHHPYATSPGQAASPLGMAYSPGAGVPIQRRGSSINNSPAGAHAAAAVLMGTPPGSLSAQAYGISPRFVGGVAPTPVPPLYAFGNAGASAEEQARLSTSASSLTGGFAARLSTSANSRTSSGGTPPSGSRRMSARRLAVRAREDEELEGEEEMGEDSTDSSPHLSVSTSASSAPPSAATAYAAAPQFARHPSSGAAAASASAAAAAAAAGETDEMAQVTAIRERLGGAANCSAFISKLWYLMCHPELYAQYIRWSEAGDAIILFSDQDVSNEFASEVLPRLFKHGNNASFIRQLNLYGFQRIPSSRLLDAQEQRAAKKLPKGSGQVSTALQLYGAHSSFSHARFQRAQEDKLPSLKPRSSKKPKRVTGAPGTAAQGGKEESDDEDDLALS